MIPVRPIRNVLAAVDLLTEPEDLVRNAAAFAAAIGADLHCVHSHQEGSTVGVGTHSWLVTQKEIHRKRMALRNLIDDALPTGRSAKSARIGIGSPAEAILENARDCDADLIVLGPHRARQIGDRYLGSTAERVLTEATVPCMILGSALPWPVRRILVPADFSAPSRSALRCGIGWVRALSDRGRVEIDFVHVADPVASSAAGTPSANDRKAELEAEASAIVAKATVKVPIHVHVIEDADPVGALSRFATARMTDLLVMGTRGDSVFLRTLLGSVSSGMLRRSTLPLLLVPPLAFADGAAAGPEYGRGMEVEPVPF